MAVAIAKIEMRRAYLRIDHKNAPCARTDETDPGLNAKSGGSAGHIHVEAKSVDTERILHFDGHGRIGALHVGGRADDAVNIARFQVCGAQGFARSRDRDFSQD